MFRKSLFGIALSIVLFACYDESSLEKLPIESSISLDNPVAYTEFHFKQLGSEIAKLANDPEFRNLVYKEIDKKFDGDNNVLLETLSVELVSTNARVADALSVNETFQASLQAFKNIDGENYFPQIYIPFFEELMAVSESSNGRIMSTESEPLFVLFTGDESQEVFPGYQLEVTSGELIKTDILVDEEYALSHEVWVISINERMDQVTSSTQDESGASSGRIETAPSAYVDQIKCKCHKESWAAGGSEVHMLLIVSDWGFENGDVNTYGKGPNEGGKIYEFSRKQVKDEKNVDVNWVILNNWDDRAPDMPYGNYVIFEYDPWPVGLRTATWWHDNTPYEYEYRSGDGYYDRNTVYNTGFATHSVSNSCIEWSSQYQ